MLVPAWVFLMVSQGVASPHGTVAFADGFWSKMSASVSRISLLLGRVGGA